MKDKKICIVGGAGFVGMNLVDMLEESNQIVVIDILDDPKKLYTTKRELRYSNYLKEGFTVFEEDIFDFVFYLAGNSSIRRSIKDPILDLNKNTVSLLEFLEITKENSAKLIFASTAACYGEMNALSSSFYYPISPYGISKYASEQYLRYYHETYHLPVLIPRFFSLFGEYNTKQVVYDTTKRLIQSPHSITVYNPLHRRDFIYIKEALRAVLFLCEKNFFQCDVFDIGRGHAISILDLTKKIAKILELKPQIKERNIAHIGDPLLQRADIEKLLKSGFKFKTSFDDNLAKTIKWVRWNL